MAKTIRKKDLDIYWRVCLSCTPSYSVQTFLTGLPRSCEHHLMTSAGLLKPLQGQMAASLQSFTGCPFPFFHPSTPLDQSRLVCSLKRRQSLTRSTMATVISSMPPKDFLVKRTDEFNTTEGTLSFSKPYRPKGSRKLRALVTFTPRKSVFDISNEASGVNEFRVSDYVAKKALLH